MRRSVGVIGLVIASLASCGGGNGPTSEVVGSTSSEIQGGTTDKIHTFAVGVVQFAQAQQNMVAFCSGVLLAPNLVATARHCVAQLSSTTIDCTSSNFGAVYPASGVFVTTDTTISMNNLVGVSTIVVPTENSQDSVCGNDIALMILDDNIALPQYVEPIIQPPMTDSQYQHEITAIGYGVDTPTDTTGATAGVRRIKEDVPLICIPNDSTDPSFDCFTDQNAKQILTASEFVSGDSTCEGDSGSGAFEQGNFNIGKWVAFGVLSRGGVSTDGMTCEQPIYSRFDAWGPLIIDAAQQAATKASNRGHPYGLAQWAGGTGMLALDAGSTVTGASTGTANSSAPLGNGEACNAPGDCASTMCIPAGDDAGSVCVSPCTNGTCASNFTCKDDLCFPDAHASTGGSGGCQVARGSTGGAATWRWPWLFAVGLAGATTRRRRSKSTCR